MAKTKLTSEIKDAIVSALEDGNYAKVAAESVGVTEQTFYNWLARGEAEKERVEGNARTKIKSSEQPFFEFFESVTRARGAAEARAVEKIKDAGEEDWRAVAWFLERRYSSRWANTQRVDLQVKEELEAALNKLEASLDSDTFEAVAKVLAGEDSD